MESTATHKYKTQFPYDYLWDVISKSKPLYKTVVDKRQDCSMIVLSLLTNRLS